MNKAPIDMHIGLEDKEGLTHGGTIIINPEDYKATIESLQGVVNAISGTMQLAAENIVAAFRGLERLIAPFMGKAYQAGYIIENRRGRNKLVQISRKGSRR